VEKSVGIGKTMKFLERVTETQMIRDGIIKWGMLQLDDSPKILCICWFNEDIMEI
jgi:hypothetical protein